MQRVSECPPFRIDRLVSGGLIVNYLCSSACAHCVYRSSPRRDRAYITPEQAEACFRAARRLGCPAMHIGGGEPFLDVEGLKAVLRAAGATDMEIDYIETNASWWRGHDQAAALLDELRDLGCRTLLISIDPFHNAHIPLAKIKGLMSSCRRAGMGVFPWRMEFFAEIDRFDDQRPHALAEYLEAYGKDYLADLMRRYGVSLGGRALRTFDALLPQQPAAAWLAASRPCRGLANASHFHLDLYGAYIPAGCPGLAIPIAALGGPVPPEQAPALIALWHGGVRALYEQAAARGFVPARKEYGSECALCDEVRAWLAGRFGEEYPDLQPREFYIIP